MKGLHLLMLVGLCVAQLPTAAHKQQQPLTQADRIPGSNNATYGPVPIAEQIFDIEYLEIAPSHIPTDRIFFLLLRGMISPSRAHAYNDTDLANAVFTGTASEVYPDGDFDGPASITLPLRTSTYSEDAHLAIRDATGAHVGFLTMDGLNDIMLDFLLPGWGLRTGLCTFEVVARLEDGTCLFAMSLTQELKGHRRWMDIQSSD